ncbi:MAG TPA: neutral zinc metallopeptidase [Pirellulales bacterium]|nr:neutral zinc metallopeptidase [Pirellulales bacterium]
MRWQGGRESENVDDQRQFGGGGVLVLLLIGWLLGADPLALLQDLQQAAPPPGPQQPAASSPEEEQLKQFVSVVLAETEDVWTELFRAQGLRYRDPHLVLFRGQIQSACGFSSAAVGPFYCPEDERVYLDLSFYQELHDRFHAQGEFAQAYVIAHEVGHHVQKLLGISDEVRARQARADQREANHLSVCLELQADFFAGVWAKHADDLRHILEPGDIESALNCAAAIGDDRLQKQSRGYVVPDSFTHGTSAQRARWFRRGYETGDMRAGDTFNAREL